MLCTHQANYNPAAELANHPPSTTPRQTIYCNPNLNLWLILTLLIKITPRKCRMKNTDNKLQMKKTQVDK